MSSATGTPNGSSTDFSKEIRKNVRSQTCLYQTYTERVDPLFESSWTCFVVRFSKAIKNNSAKIQQIYLLGVVYTLSNLIASNQITGRLIINFTTTSHIPN